jgi:hypothetical protein
MCGGHTSGQSERAQDFHPAAVKLTGDLILGAEYSAPAIFDIAPPLNGVPGNMYTLLSEILAAIISTNDRLDLQTSVQLSILDDLDAYLPSLQGDTNAILLILEDLTSNAAALNVNNNGTFAP